MAADKTKIEWTDATWNPIRVTRKGDAQSPVGWFCEHVSEGCRFCYSEVLNRRLGTAINYKPGNRPLLNFYLDGKTLRQPIAWARPRMVFPCSMTDLFLNAHSQWVDAIFGAMALAHWHTFQLLTKRPERMRDYLNDPGTPKRVWTAAAVQAQACKDGALQRAFERHGGDFSWDKPCWPLRNVWAGTSIEDHAAAKARVPALLACNAVIRWVSVEPMLGDIDLRDLPNSEGFGEGQPWLDALNGWVFTSSGTDGCSAPKLDWVVAGGESGANARYLPVARAHAILDACREANTPFFFKQWGEWKPSDRPLGPDVNAIEHFSLSSVDRRLSPKSMLTDNHGFAYVKVGKKIAGRTLLGRTWEAYPEAK